jgi:hypothetical protein
MGGSIWGNCQGNKNFTTSVGCCLQQFNSMASFVSSWCTNKSWSYTSLFKCTVLSALKFGIRTVPQLCSGSITLTCRRTPHRFLLTANEPPVKEFCTIAHELWIAAEEEKTILPCFRVLGNTFEIITLNTLRFVLPTSQCLLENSTLL